MKLIYDAEKFSSEQGTVATIGFFDGVHKGHRYLIEQVKSEARRLNLNSLIITFDQHPRMVLNQDFQPRLLNTLSEKLELLQQTEADLCCVLPFTKHLSKYSSYEFLEKILRDKFNVKKLIIGHDHRFGHNREDNFNNYKQYGRQLGVDIEQTPPYVEDDVIISSSVIRRLLDKGDVEQANHFLGYRYFFSGTVVQGKKIGRTIQYPTANIAFDDKKETPIPGVYAVKVVIKGNEFGGMLNVGTRPTLNADEKKQTIEVNIFDFDEEIYGELIKIVLIKKVRDEQKFDSLAELAAQIGKDKEIIQLIVNS